MGAYPVRCGRGSVPNVLDQNCESPGPGPDRRQVDVPGGVRARRRAEAPRRATAHDRRHLAEDAYADAAQRRRRTGSSSARSSIASRRRWSTGSRRSARRARRSARSVAGRWGTCLDCRRRAALRRKVTRGVRIGEAKLGSVVEALVCGNPRAAHRSAGEGGLRLAGSLRPGHVGVVRRHDRRAVGAARRLAVADGTRSVQTSTTNIGAYLWSAVAASAWVSSAARVVARLSRTLGTLERMERSRPAASTSTGTTTAPAKLTTWPPDRRAVHPDPVLGRQRLAGGRAARVAQLGVPELSRAGQARCFDSMDFGFYYVRAQPHPVPLRPGRPPQAPCCYDTTVSESRIVDYLGIAKGELPPRHYYGALAHVPRRLRLELAGDPPGRATARYFGVDVFEGAYPYNGTRVVPSWGGSMFEALMPTLFVPEEGWAPGSWRVNHPLTVRRRSTTACSRPATATGASHPPTSPRAATPSTASTPSAWTRTATRPTRTARSSTTASPAARWPARAARPAAFGLHQRRVTPHAASSALRYAPRALANLRRLAHDFPGLYGAEASATA